MSRACPPNSTGLRSSATLLSALGRKKAVLLDQFGVLHDGQKLYRGAGEAVEYLHKDLGLQILIVSNSSRRADGALAGLEKKGMDIGSIANVITSGEVTASALQTAPREEAFREMHRCVHFTWGSRGAISLDGLDVEVVGHDVGSADFILAHGTEAVGTSEGPEESSLDEMKRLLEKAAERGLPMVVANPDLVTVSGPQLVTMPGTLAKFYEDIGGGIVHRMGKPDRRIYLEALRLLGLEASEVMAVGDSMEHDIAGASAMGIDSIFIAGGIHKQALMGDGDENVDEAVMTALCAEFGCTPTHVLPWFRC